MPRRHRRFVCHSSCHSGVVSFTTPWAKVCIIRPAQVCAEGGAAENPLYPFATSQSSGSVQKRLLAKQSGGLQSNCHFNYIPGKQCSVFLSNYPLRISILVAQHGYLRFWAVRPPQLRKSPRI